MNEIGVSRATQGRGPSDRFGLASAAIQRILSSQRRWSTAVAAAFLLQFALIFTHRPWVDEWQALQIALETPTLASLLDNLLYEGHPPLWYLLLRAGSWIIPTYWILPVVTAGLAAAAQAIILFRSPFSRVERLALSLGVVMLFEYMTIARGTTLGVALSLIALASFKSRWSWLPLALLPLVDLPFGVISIALIALRARDRTLWAPGLALWLICGLLAAWTVIPAADMVPANQRNLWWFDAYQWVERMGFLLVPFQMIGSQIRWEAFLPLRLGLVCGPLFLWFAYRQTRHDRLHLILYGGIISLSFVFSVAVYPQHVRHLAVLALPLYLLKWRDCEAGRTPDHAFRLWLVTGAVCGLIVTAVNFTRPFDDAHRAAAFIEAHGLTGKRWLVYPENRAQGISALTATPFERVGQNCTQTLIRWNARTEIYDYRDLEAYLRAKLRNDGRFYLMTDFAVDALPRDLVRTLASYEGSYGGQRYVLSVVGSGAAERSRVLPSCVPGLRPLVRPTIWSLF